MIKQEKDALHAMTLHRLLTKKWSEYPNSYKVMSKIRQKQTFRLNELMDDNRYAP